MVYIAYHLINAFDDSVVFEEAQAYNAKQTVVSDGVIFRDEDVLRTSHNGVLEALFDEGEHVPANTDVARIYGDVSDESRERIADIDRRIKLLESSNLTSTSLFDTKYVDKQISEMYYLICDKLSRGDLEYAAGKTDDLTVLLNQREIITNKRLNFNNEIAALKAQRESITGSVANSHTVKTSASGYYYSVTDGYETTFDPDMLASITPEEFDSLRKQPAVSYTQDNGGFSAGKTVSSHTWYIACPIDKIVASGFDEGAVYTVSFPYSANEMIDFTLERIASTPNSENALLILKTNIVPGTFSFTRTQKIEIVYDSVGGVRIPAGALRIIDGEYGVYILDENVVRFIKTDIIYEGDGYYISKTDYPEDDTQVRLKEHDRIITGGKELSDGKLIG